MNTANPNVLMVFPRFPARTFWAMPEPCEFFGARCITAPLGLITLAALLPKEWKIRLVNRNAEELNDADLDWADMVMTGGMLPQRADSLAVIALAQRHGKPVVVGGPDVMSSPEEFEHVEFRVLGEAENLIGEFIAAWRQGERSGTYNTERFQVDVSKSPTPRFDLLNFSHYLYIGVQFSRGCPFNCEFCDIIELYGRVPRTKTTDQVLRELDMLYLAGYRGHVDFVDDNLIGNKKALKKFLPELRKWQEERHFPFQFSTEASMNLSDDAQLLQMMRACNFFLVFMGIETPDAEALAHTQKKQNTRRSIADSVARVHAAGMEVTAGFIIGFDTEKSSVAQQMIDCVEATNIPLAFLGLLTALPGTQLTRRLEREGRLLPYNASMCLGDAAGLNFMTLRSRREVLTDYRTVVEAIYSPRVYFERVRRMARALDAPHHTVFPAKGMVFGIAKFCSAVWKFGVRSREIRPYFWRNLIDVALHRPASIEALIAGMVLYTHLGPFSRFLMGEIDRHLESEPAELLSVPEIAELRQIA